MCVPSSSALSLALLLGAPPDEPLVVAQGLARAHDDDTQRINARELEPHTLARCAHRLPPIPSGVSAHMRAWPPERSSTGTYI